MTEPWDDAQVEEGRRLFAAECRFLRGAPTLKALPPIGLPEIAFAGRSNVGKSSLVNALTGRKTLARTSNTPGRTQELNFFDLGGRLSLVDLPGYGFAKAPRDKVEAWTDTVLAYLRGRVSLKRVCVLIDSRHGLKPIDREVMEMLDQCAVSYQILLTKADKIKPETLTQVHADTEAALAKRPAAFPLLLDTSSVTGLGVTALRACLAALALPRETLSPVEG